MKQLGLISSCITIVFVLLIAFLCVAGVFGYKRLAGLNTNVDSRWSEVEKEYRNRSLFIPQLTQMLSAESSLDKATLAQPIRAQEEVDAIKLDPNQAPADADQFQRYVEAQQALTKALSPILLAALKNSSFTDDKNLQAQLAKIFESENRLVLKQSRFDQAVQAYNTQIHRFPLAVEANVLGFKPRPSFQP